MAQRILEFDRLQSLFIDLFVLLRGGPLLLGVDGGAHTRRQRHAERHHDHERLLILAFNLADGGRDDHHAGIAVETFMMREAKVLLFLHVLAVRALLDDRRLLAKLDPGRLGAGIGGWLCGLGRCGVLGGRGSRSCRRRLWLDLDFLFLCGRRPGERKRCKRDSRKQ